MQLGFGGCGLPNLDGIWTCVAGSEPWRWDEGGSESPCLKKSGSSVEGLGIPSTLHPRRRTTHRPHLCDKNKKDCLEAKSQPCHSLFVLVRCPASTWPTYTWFLFPGYWGKSTWAHSSLSDTNFCLQVVTVSLMKNAKNTCNNEEQRLLLNTVSMLLR